MKANRVVLDGEIVAVDGSGVPSFQALQHRSARTDHQIVFYAFDVLHIDGVDLTGAALTERRMRLPQVLMGSGVLMSIELPGSASQVIEAVSALVLKVSSQSAAIPSTSLASAAASSSNSTSNRSLLLAATGQIVEK